MQGSKMNHFRHFTHSITELDKSSLPPRSMTTDDLSKIVIEMKEMEMSELKEENEGLSETEIESETDDEVTPCPNEIRWTNEQKSEPMMIMNRYSPKKKPRLIY